MRPIDVKWAYRDLLTGDVRLITVNGRKVIQIGPEISTILILRSDSTYTRPYLQYGLFPPTKE